MERGQRTKGRVERGWVRVTGKLKGGQPKVNTVRRHYERKNITTFFFSRFPEEYVEVDIWKVFIKWGKVWEVFISKRRSKGGHRYGFVRFEGVQNVKALEAELDQIHIGGMKMFVNVPKYSKMARKLEGRKVERSANMRKEETIIRTGLGVKADVVDYRMQKTYAQTVQGKTSVFQQQKNEEDWVGIDVKIEEKEMDLVKECLIGWLRDVTMYNRIQEFMVPHELKDVKLRYIGDDRVLISGIEMTMAEKMINSGKETFLSLFHSIKKWTPDSRSGNRLTWVRCFRIPIHVWGRNIFSIIANTCGSLVDVHSETISLVNLEAARLLISTPMTKNIDRLDMVRINGSVFSIKIVEELNHEGNDCKCWRWKLDDSLGEESNVDSNEGLEIISSQSECSSHERECWIEEIRECQVVTRKKLGRVSEEISKESHKYSRLEEPVVNNHDVVRGDSKDADLFSDKQRNVQEKKGCQEDKEKVGYESRQGTHCRISISNVRGCEESKGLNVVLEGEPTVPFESPNIGPSSVGPSKEWAANGECSKHTSKKCLSKPHADTPTPPQKLHDPILEGVSRRMIPERYDALRRPYSMPSHSQQPSLSSSSSIRKEFRKEIMAEIFSHDLILNDDMLRNCNKNFWQRKQEEEARKTWEIGKALGVSFKGSEEEIIGKFINMEQRDVDGIEAVKKSHLEGEAIVDQ